MKHQGYLLDTNICISMLKNKYGVREAILRVKVENCFISEITLAELYFGASNSNNKEARLKDVAFVVSHFRIIEISETLPLYGDLKATLRRNGTPIDDFDLLIGSAAIANNLVMVTDNVKHLNKLSGIIVENWTER